MNTKIRPAIAGKVTIVTGASSGIGEVTALDYASAGAKVVLAARRIERLQKLAETIRAATEARSRLDGTRTRGTSPDDRRVEQRADRREINRQPIHDQISCE